MLSKKGVATEIAQHLILEFHGLLIIDLFHAHLTLNDGVIGYFGAM